MKLLSDTCEYGLQAVAWLAVHPREPHKARDIASGIQVSPGYLLKVMQELARHHIVATPRGSQGGFLLRCDPRQLTALEVIHAIDRTDRIRVSAPTNAVCVSAVSAIHSCLDEVMEQIESRFASVTIQDLIDRETTRCCQEKPEMQGASTNLWQRAAEG